MTMRRAVVAVLPAFVAAKVLTAVAIIVSVEHTAGHLSWGLLRQAFVHWDAVSYLDIAANGYSAGRLDYHDAFLPGYPLLVRAASFLTGDLVVAAVVVSSLAGLAGLAAVFVLVCRERDRGSALFCAWGVALAPVGFFLSGVYTESAFIAAAAIALLLVRAGRMRDAALAAAVATSLRLTGLVLVPVLVVEMVRQRRLRSGARWLAIVPLPIVLYGVYMQARIGDPVALLHAQALPSFGEAAAWPWDGLRSTWNTAVTSTDPTNRAIFVREVVAGVVGLIVVVAGWADARFPRSFALYCTLVWLMAVSLAFWRSEPRYDLALFPAVLVLADVTGRARRLRPVLVSGGAAILAWSAFVFAEGGWVG